MARGRQAAAKGSADGPGANHSMGRPGRDSGGMCRACIPGVPMVFDCAADSGCALADERLIERVPRRAVDEFARGAAGGLVCPRPELHGAGFRSLSPIVDPNGLETREGIKAARGVKKLAHSFALYVMMTSGGLAPCYEEAEVLWISSKWLPRSPQKLPPATAEP